MKLTTIGWWGAYPGLNEAASGYLIQSDNTNILIDCGSGILSLLPEYIDMNLLDAVILSHYHPDHFSDIYCLQYAMRIQIDLGNRKYPLKIYGHTETEHFNSLAYHHYTKACSFTAEKQLSIGDMSITFCKTVHPVPCFAVKIEQCKKTIVYSSDSEYCIDLVDFAKNTDLFLCEASLYNEFSGKVPGHLTAGEAGHIASQAGTGSLVLTHLPHYGNHSLLLKQAKEKYKGSVYLAKTGKTFLL